MKYIFLFFYIFFVNSVYSQKSFKVDFKDKNKLTDLVTNIFDGYYNNINNEIIWEPNTSEILEFGQPYDGKLYSKIVEIIEHGENLEYKTLAIYTFKKNEYNEFEDCHACSPILSILTLNNDDTEYKILNFKKFVGAHGEWGEPAEIEIINFNSYQYFLSVTDTFFTGGVQIVRKSIYLNNNLLFSYDSYFDDSGAIGDNKSTSFETTLEIDQNQNIIILSKKGKIFDDKTKRRIPVNEIIKYKLDDYNNIIRL